MKTILFAALGTVLIAGPAAAASQYSVWGDDRGVTLHAPYQQGFETRNIERSGDTGLTGTFGLAGPSAVSGDTERSTGDLVYKSDGDPGIVLHGRSDGYTVAR